MEVQRRLRTGRHERDARSEEGGRARLAGTGKRMKETAGWGRQRGQPGEEERARGLSRYSLDDLCGSDAISEASLESGL